VATSGKSASPPPVEAAALFELPRLLVYNSDRDCTVWATGHEARSSL